MDANSTSTKRTAALHHDRHDAPAARRHHRHGVAVPQWPRCSRPASVRLLVTLNVGGQGARFLEVAR